MTQENKELLLKDLCARLPYGVKVRIYNPYRGEYEYEYITIDNYNEIISTFDISWIEPCLFPLSSMTDEQKSEWRTINNWLDETKKNQTLGDWAVDLIDFYNKNHFDYRGLIPKGLAIDSTGLNIY